MQNILLIKAFEKDDGFIGELADSYAKASAETGAITEEINVYDLHFDFLVHPSKINLAQLEPDLYAVREQIARAKHLVIFIPVLKREIPFKTKSFFDRLFTLEMNRPITALWEHISFSEKSARIISVTDDEVWKEFKTNRTSEYHPIHKNTLELFGIGKVYTTTIGPVKTDIYNNYRKKWLKKIKELGLKQF